MLNTITSGVYLLAAKDTGGQKGVSTFLDSDLGGVLKSVCAAIAVIVIVVGILAMVKHAPKGELGKGLKALIPSLIIGALLFNINVTADFLSSASGLAQKAFNSVSTVIGGGDDGGGHK